MFDDIKAYLEGLTPKEKADLVNNLKEFQRFKTLLEAKGVVVKDEKTGDLLIVKEHAFVNSFLNIFKKLTLQGVKVIDKRKDKDTIFEHSDQKNDKRKKQ